MGNDLSHMSEDQLASVIESAQRALRDKQLGKRKEVIAEIRRLATSAGLTVEISEGSKPVSARKGSKVSAKYRNPHNHEQTWTGRGMKPRWLKAFIDQGHDIREFSV